MPLSTPMLNQDDHIMEQIKNENINIMQGKYVDCKFMIEITRMKHTPSQKYQDSNNSLIREGG